MEGAGLSARGPTSSAPPVPVRLLSGARRRDFSEQWSAVVSTLFSCSVVPRRRKCSVISRRWKCCVVSRLFGSALRSKLWKCLKCDQDEGRSVMGGAGIAALGSIKD